MPLCVSEDIHSITDLKRNTATLLNQVHSTGRPVILTVNGRAEVVMLDAREYDKLIGAFRLLKDLLPAEEEVRAGKTRDAKEFFRVIRSSKLLD